MLCARLKDNKNNDGYNCKYFEECNEENNYPRFEPTYKPKEGNNMLKAIISMAKQRGRDEIFKEIDDMCEKESDD